MTSICIVIPMHNEEKIAKESVKEIFSYIKHLPCLSKIAIVNDGSKDRTKEIVEEFISKNHSDSIELLSHDNNEGYGAALRTGIQFAISSNYDYVLFMDSDLTNHPKYLKDFCIKINEGFEYIKATRYSKGGSVCGVTLSYRIISTVGNFIAKILYGLPINDLTNGFRAVKTDILKKIELKENGFAIIMEELYQAKGLAKSFCEIPYVLTARQEGQGKTHFSYSFGMCMKYLKYALKALIVKRIY